MAYIGNKSNFNRQKKMRYVRIVYKSCKIFIFRAILIGRVTCVAMAAGLDGIKLYCGTRINDQILELFLVLSVNKNKLQGVEIISIFAR